MSLQPATQHLQREIFRGLIAPGVVVDNNDPKKLLRVRVRVAELHRDVPNADLPWALPMHLGGAMGINGSVGAISVPAIGAKVALSFMDDSLYSPYYLSWRAEANDLPQELLADYPKCYGHIDAFGNLFLVNTELGTITMHHKTGTKIQVGGDGTMEVWLAKKFIMHGHAEVEIRGSGEVKVHSAVKVDVRAPRIDLNKSTSGTAPGALTARQTPAAVTPPDPSI